MRFTVTGGRDYWNRVIIWDVLSLFPRRGTELLVGDASGLDTVAAEFGEKLGFSVTKFVADWKNHGLAAGPIRNKNILAKEPSFVIAFPGGKGTENMVKQAKEKGILVFRVETDEEGNG